LILTALAFAMAIAAVVTIASAYGLETFADAWSRLHWGWLALAVGAAMLAIPAYVVSYRAVARAQDGPKLRLPLVIRLVSVGFGPFAAGGGFALDKRALHAIEDDEHAATVRVLGLGALEWAVLAPAAWLSAVVLLAGGDRRPMPSLLWPWAIAVPIGFVLGLWLAVPARRERLAGRAGRWRQVLARALHGVGVLHWLARGFWSCWAAWIGTAVYWALDIASFYGAARFIGSHLNLAETILAYATGYALTRRSMPLGGAGVTEALMTFALHWVGQPVAPALAIVVVYRLFNFALPTIPALLARPRIKPLLDAADLDRTPTQRERRRAADPISLPQR
jgi:uncharacterized membrane protein YbhN (UPF0104 family)